MSQYVSASHISEQQNQEKQSLPRRRQIEGMLLEKSAKRGVFSASNMGASHVTPRIMLDHAVRVGAFGHQDINPTT